MYFIDEEVHRDHCGIYRIFNIETGLSYIGKTGESFQRRYWHHVWSLRKNVHANKWLQNSWNKYGENVFRFEVLAYSSDEDEMNELERHYIEIYRIMGLSCNISSGGDGKSGVAMSEHAKRIVGEKNRRHMTGRKASEETRAKMRKSSKHISPSEDHRAKLREYMSNRVVSDETKAKIAKAFAGSKSSFAKLNEKQVEEIKRRLMDGESTGSLAKDFGVSYTAIAYIKKRKTWNNVHVDGWDDFVG